MKPERPLRATSLGRSRSSERLGQSDTPRSLAFLLSDDTKWSRSDHLRSLPKPGATCQSDVPRSLHVLYLVELMIYQGPFGHFIMHVLHFLNLCLSIFCKPLEADYLLSKENHQNPLENSKLDHPKFNLYAHEFSFPLVKKVTSFIIFIILQLH
ncbi:hypothetical protein IGI04_012283 [Brassica rapa subsp. trilocularis]|uniref:Uncharacterized protein n=1 Tax=Brassica rapa subsp. trilocularis TaxID=1813537 RepID=A0ABQ7N5H2_BRACM|nr:hypothetical protein IGI04_012283 [Brassica rapa subsp. trilocularis]